MQLSHLYSLTWRLLLCISFAGTQSRPSPSLNNDSGLPLAIQSNASGASTKSFAASYSIPFQYRNINFTFDFIGDAIPKREVENVLAGADLAIIDLVDDEPFSPIANNRFEYRLPDGHVLISIQANPGKTIVWTILFRLLQGLYRFMLGLRTGQNHCRALRFAFGTNAETAIGLGVVWYFAPKQSDISKRAVIPSPGLLVNEINETSGTSYESIDSFNASRVKGDIIAWHIPDTSLTLDFHFFGKPIPQQDLLLALAGATANVSRWLNTPFEDECISNEVYDWRAPYSHDGSETGITVHSYISHDVTWRQTYDILSGLEQYATREAQKHCQILGFKIRNLHEGTIGTGTLWHYPRSVTAVEERIPSLGRTSLGTRNTSSKSLSADPSQSPIPWYIPSTAIVLNFTFFGHSVPLSHIGQTLQEAQEEVIGIASVSSTYMIDRYSYTSGDGHVVINIISSFTNGISWQHVSEILGGVMSFCESDHSQVLVFDIEIGTHLVGFGTLLEFGEFETLAKRGMNGTSSLVLPIAGKTSTHFLIPGTPDSLLFTDFGPEIPSTKARSALSGAMNVISLFVQQTPDSRIPRNKYRFDDEQGVSIVISVSAFSEVTWSELDEVLAGLSCFMTGINPLPGQDFSPHYQTLAFGIYLSNQGYVGSGVVTYKWTHHVAMVKRASKSATSNHRLVDLQGTTTFQALNGSSLSTPFPIPFPVPLTPVALHFAALRTTMLIDRVLVMLYTARSSIINEVASKPDARIPRNWFQRSGTSGERGGKASILVHGYVDRDLTWSQMDAVLAGLIAIVSSSSRNIAPGLKFEIEVTSIGAVGTGAVWYESGEDVLTQRTIPRDTNLLGSGVDDHASLSHNQSLGTISAQTIHRLSSFAAPTHNNSMPSPDEPPLPFPIVQSPMTLLFTNFGIHRIPLPRLEELFATVFKHIDPSVKTHPNSSITPSPWYYELDYPRSKGNLSISIYTGPKTPLSWLHLSQLLKGLEVFMLSQSATLRFDIDMINQGNVGYGLVEYRPPRFSNNNLTLTERNQNLTAMIPYPVSNTPITLQIKLSRDRVPLIYARAALTNALREISQNESPNSKIDDNHFSYVELAGGVAIGYTGYDSEEVITWQQLAWVIAGLEKFMNDGEEHCRTLTAEVDIHEVGQSSAHRLGSLTLWYVDPYEAVSEI